MGKLKISRVKAKVCTNPYSESVKRLNEYMDDDIFTLVDNGTWDKIMGVLQGGIFSRIEVRIRTFGFRKRHA